MYRRTVRTGTDSGFLTKTLVLPIWYWSVSMLTERRRWRTPCCSGPLQQGHVSAVRMAYLEGKSAGAAFTNPWVWLPSIRCTEMTHPVGGRAGLNSPHQELVKNSAICISSPSHAYVFPQTQVLDLVLRSADRWKTQVEEICCVTSAGALAVTLLACSPPSLWVFSSHWVWCSGCSVVCTSSECWPDRWLASVGTHQGRSKQSLVCERCVDSS